jgi:hypothetical protein
MRSSEPNSLFQTLNQYGSLARDSGDHPRRRNANFERVETQALVPSHGEAKVFATVALVLQFAPLPGSQSPILSIRKTVQISDLLLKL